MWVDLGGGTGENVSLMSQYIDLSRFRHIYVVDLCKSLCEQVRWGSETAQEGPKRALFVVAPLSLPFSSMLTSPAAVSLPRIARLP